MIFDLLNSPSLISPIILSLELVFWDKEFLFKDAGIEKTKTNFLANSIQEKVFYKTIF